MMRDLQTASLGNFRNGWIQMGVETGEGRGAWKVRRERGLRWEELVGDTLGGGWKTCSLFYFDAKFGAWLLRGKSLSVEMICCRPLCVRPGPQRQKGETQSMTTVFRQRFRLSHELTMFPTLHEIKCQFAHWPHPDKVGMVCP